MSIARNVVVEPARPTPFCCHLVLVCVRGSCSARVKLRYVHRIRRCRQHCLARPHKRTDRLERCFVACACAASPVHLRALPPTCTYRRTWRPAEASRGRHVLSCRARRVQCLACVVRGDREWQSAQHMRRSYTRHTQLTMDSKRKLSDLQLEECKRVFAISDRDGSGTISTNELKVL